MKLLPSLLHPLILLGLLSSPAQSQFATDSQSLLTSSSTFLPVDQAYSAEVAILDGETLSVRWQMEPGYYLYRDRFGFHAPGDLDLTPTFEPGIVKYDEFFDEELEVYYEQTSVSVEGHSGPDLILEFQGCADAGLCYPPAFYQFQLDYSSGTSEFIGKVTSPIFASTIDSPIQTMPSRTANTGLWIALTFALLGGLILNVMPCVFPVLSLKALSLAKSAGNRSELLSQGLFYTLGSISVAVALAGALLLLRQTGTALGWGFQLQSPAIITTLLFLFAIMALSLSGAFLFGTALMGLGQNLETGGKPGHAFSTGALAMFVASPCTAPFMGVALGYAMLQPWFIALPVFAALGLGMALPIVLLSIAPNLSAKLPAPGPWLETFKQFLAFPLYLTCVWLLWILIRQMDATAIALILCGLVLAVMAIWINQKLAGKAKVLALMLVLPVAVYCTYTGLTNESQTDTGNEANLSMQEIEARTGGSRPVFVNLTADWCITCLVNEKRALGTERVLAAFAEHNVDYLVGDWTRQNPQISNILSHFDRVGVPLYLYYPPYQTDPVVLPQFLSESTILDLIAQSN